MESNKLKKDFDKLNLVSELKRLIDSWNEIYKRDRKITKDNFEEVIGGAWEIVVRLKNLESLCNPPINELDVSLLNWAREKKPQYESLAFDIEVDWKRMSRLNEELLMVRIDNDKSEGCLFIIFESAKDKEIAREQTNLFYELYKKFIAYTNENGDCDVVSFLNDLEKIKSYFPHPFTYAFIPEGDRKISEELLRETLGKKLNSKNLKEIYSSRKNERLNSFPIFRLRIKEKKPNEEMVEKGYFFTDPNYYKGVKESLHAK